LTNTGPVPAGAAVTVGFVNASDPTSVDMAAGLHFAFATDPATLANATYANSGTSPTTTFVFNTGGNVAVYGRVIDKDGGFSQDSTVVDVVAPGDVTALMHIAQGGFVYNRATGHFLESVTITNASNFPVGAPMDLVLDGLTSGVTLVNATGIASNGSPEVLVPLGTSGELAPGQAVTVTLVFADPSHTQIGYTPRVLATSVPATDVTSQASIKLGGFTYDRATGHFLESVTITNTSSSAFVGPLALALDGLPSGVSLFNASGTTAGTSPAGSPYITLPLSGALQPGQSVTVVLVFVDPGKVQIGFHARLLEGPGEF
jgi:hypothetical protein